MTPQPLLPIGEPAAAPAPPAPVPPSPPALSSLVLGDPVLVCHAASAPPSPVRIAIVSRAASGPRCRTIRTRDARGEEYAYLVSNGAMFGNHPYRIRALLPGETAERWTERNEWEQAKAALDAAGGAT